MIVIIGNMISEVKNKMEPAKEQNEKFVKLLDLRIEHDLTLQEFVETCQLNVFWLQDYGLNLAEICDFPRKAAEIFPENHLFYNGRYPVDKNGYFHIQEQDGDDNDPVLYAKVFVGDITKYECNRFRTYGRIPYRFDGKIPEQSYKIYESGEKYRSSDWVFDYRDKEK